MAAKGDTVKNVSLTLTTMDKSQSSPVPSWFSAIFWGLSLLLSLHVMLYLCLLLHDKEKCTVSSIQPCFPSLRSLDRAFQWNSQSASFSEASHACPNKVKGFSSFPTPDSAIAINGSFFLFFSVASPSCHIPLYLSFFSYLPSYVHSSPKWTIVRVCTNL